MTNIEALKSKVLQLEELATKIELDTRNMFKNFRLECITSSLPGISPVYLWIKPNDEAWKELQRNVIRNYQEWYTTAYQLVQYYIPDRLEEFTSYYSHKGGHPSGFIRAVKIEIVVHDNNVQETVNNYIEWFDMQISLLHSLPSVAEAKEMACTSSSSNPIDLISNLCERFQFVVRQLRDTRKGHEPLDITDEYDVQYLIHALLKLHFDDIRAEEVTPSYAGGSARMDFLLKQEQIGLETKMTRCGLDARELGTQLIEDIARYQAHQDCKTLICFVYDPEGLIANPKGIEGDLNKLGKELHVQTFIRP